MAKHTFEEKLDIVSQVKNGKPILRISRERHIGERMILDWVRKYNLYGENGLLKRPNTRTTTDFREEMVRTVIEKKVSLGQVVLQYGVSRTALERWVKSVRIEGYGALHQQKKRGRPPKDMSRSKKHEPETELEKLQAENARLRAENALLKKVTALVKEREARERMSGRKPSKS
ncbi:transposase [Sphingobacterium sp. CZ-UAM]|uniref:helix-turn-helix domain-containing protein n=1 Tax=Sphingobacterium sp. CZ-UAM TaxID=1933868 RepID=UPI000987BE12|nr:helix-turn-helix domain-containing protein [Sphingobacterium sp. CZ-UAM]OOG18130.1 transposase [Sphingobacterium sp. CZ-UAM]